MTTGTAFDRSYMKPPAHATIQRATFPSTQERERVSDVAASQPIDASSDQHLMALIAEQPTVALAALYDRYGRYVFSVALRMVGDRNSAEEVTQDVFLACWRNAASYNAQRGSLITWLLTIAHRRGIDELRSRRNTQRKHEMNWEHAPQHALASEQEVDLALLQTEIRQALEGLPTNQREAVEMLYFGGLTRQEIADRLRTPLGTINTRLRLGLDKLRVMFGEGKAGETR